MDEPQGTAQCRACGARAWAGGEIRAPDGCCGGGIVPVPCPGCIDCLRRRQTTDCRVCGAPPWGAGDLCGCGVIEGRGKDRQQATSLTGIHQLPGRCDGGPVSAGRRFTLAQLVAQLSEGMSLAEVCHEFDLDRDTAAKALGTLSVFLQKPGCLP